MDRHKTNYELKQAVLDIYRGKWMQAVISISLLRTLLEFFVFRFVFSLFLIVPLFVFMVYALFGLVAGTVFLVIAVVLTVIYVLFLPLISYLNTWFFMKSGKNPGGYFRLIFSKKYFRPMLRAFFITLLFSIILAIGIGAFSISYVMIVINLYDYFFMYLFKLIPLIFIDYLIILYLKTVYLPSVFIFFDRLDNNEPVSFLACLTDSRLLTKGHRGRYFILELGMIGWRLLGTFISFSNFWVIPYLYGVECMFYFEVIKDEPQVNMEVLEIEQK